MHPLLQSKYVRVGGIGIFILVILIVTWAFVNITSTSTGLSDESYYGEVPVVVSGVNYETRSFSADQGMMPESVSVSDSAYYPPTPNTGNYTADLEAYETTAYSVFGKTRQFDELCSTIRTLKSDPSIHFKSLDEATNVCYSNFYVEENKAEGVLATLKAFKGVEYTRNTESVTRHRQQIQSQTSIIEQQLASVQKSLSTAETQLNNLTSIYLTNDDVATLSRRVNESLALIDSLTQRKINLTSQLNNLYQQASDLEERLKVVEFSVKVNRLNPVYPNKNSQMWESAWSGLKDTYDETLIAITAGLATFLLLVGQVVVYGLILIVMARYLLRLIKLIWNK